MVRIIRYVGITIGLFVILILVVNIIQPLKSVTMEKKAMFYNVLKIVIRPVRHLL